MRLDFSKVTGGDCSVQGGRQDVFGNLKCLDVGLTSLNTSRRQRFRSAFAVSSNPKAHLENESFSQRPTEFFHQIKQP